MVLRILALLVGMMALNAVEAVPSEYFDDNTLSAVEMERTFVSLNSTYIAYGIAAGAVLILILAVGLYLYDYYYGTSRSDPLPEGYDQYYDPNQYAQYAYQQQADNYRYNQIPSI